MTRTTIQARPGAKSGVSVEELVCQKILAALEAGTAPWRSPYTAASLPRSLSTGKPYRGINVMLLAMDGGDAGYSSPWWGTYKRISDMDGQVRKGEKSSLATFWKRLVKEEVTDTGELRERSFFFLRQYRVFNACQADGLHERYLSTPNAHNGDWDADASADAIIAGYVEKDGPRMVSDDQLCAWYRPSTDTVNVPKPANMAGRAEWYSTAFHELTHSTGAAKRLGREGIVSLPSHRRGTTYSFEELVAETGAAMLCAHAGIDNTVDNSAAYIASWLRYLKDDPKQVIRAAGQAQRAVDLIQGVTFTEGE